jgi:hypothetical protein
VGVVISRFGRGGACRERLDYYTHHAPPSPTGENRKEFIAVLAHEVLQRLLVTPISTWIPLAQAFGQSLDARETTVWARDAMVERAVSAHRWDGSIPAVAGDFPPWQEISSGLAA